MRYSLQLVADKLCAQGHRAYVLNGSGVQFDRLRLMQGSPPRMLQGGAEQLEEGVLYVCDCIPQQALLSGMRGCAFAMTARPQHGFELPCLVVESAQSAIDLLNALATKKDELDAAYLEMSEHAWNENGLSDIVETLARIVGNPVYIVDSSFKVLAITDDPDMEEMSVNWMNAARYGYLSYSLIANLIRSNELHDIESTTRATVVNSEYFYTPFANYNLRAEGKVQGHLFVVQMYRVIMPSDLELIDAAVPHVMRALQANSAFQARRGPVYEHFFIDWLEGKLGDAAYIQQQLDALSFDARALSLVVRIQLLVDGDLRREHLARLLEDRQGCRCVAQEGSVVALFQLRKRGEEGEVLKRVGTICRNQQCRAYASDVHESLLDSPIAFQQVCGTQRICDQLGIEREVVRYGEVAMLQPCLNFSSAHELDAFCHPALGALLEHDRTHAVKLMPTLSAYLKNERDVQAAAAQMYIHRNTLTYRMKKVQELCGFDLDDFGTRQRVLQSILILENWEGVVSWLHQKIPAASSEHE